MQHAKKYASRRYVIAFFLPYRDVGKMSTADISFKIIALIVDKLGVEESEITDEESLIGVDSLIFLNYSWMWRPVNNDKHASEPRS